MRCEQYIFTFNESVTPCEIASCFSAACRFMEEIFGADDVAVHCVFYVDLAQGRCLLRARNLSGAILGSIFATFVRTVLSRKVTSVSHQVCRNCRTSRQECLQ